MATAFFLTGTAFGLLAKSLAIWEQALRPIPERLGVSGKSFRMPANCFGESPIGQEVSLKPIAVFPKPIGVSAEPIGEPPISLVETVIGLGRADIG